MKMIYDLAGAYVLRFVVSACRKVLRASFRMDATSGQVCSSLTIADTTASCEIQGGMFLAFDVRPSYIHCIKDLALYIDQHLKAF